MATSPLRAAVGQLEPSDDRARNLATIEHLAQRAASEGAGLLVLPELAVTGWGNDATQIPRLAEPLDGPSVAALERISDEHCIAIIAGLYETSDDSRGRPYNCLVAVAPGQGRVASHRKCHLYDAWGYRESDDVAPGDGALALFDLAGMRIGIVNCYEARFPDRAAALVDAGADVLAVSAAWARGPLKEDHWELVVRARAVESTVWVVAASLTGSAVVGRSLVVDPLGVVRAQLDESSDDVATVSLDRYRIDAARRSLPVLEQRRSSYPSR